MDLQSIPFGLSGTDPNQSKTLILPEKMLFATLQKATDIDVFCILFSKPSSQSNF
jgi:hypothetical protein